jgi:hypothetical protein
MIEIFEKESIQVEHIPLLTADEFSALGVTRIGQRWTLKEKAKRFLSR